MNSRSNMISWGFILALATSISAQAQDVRVIVGGEIKPGVYGRVEIGNQPPPPVLYPQPVIIVKQPVQVVSPGPVYLHVPPGHAKKWGKHCYKYNACNQPVYFVKTPGQPTYAHGHGDRHGHKQRGKKHDD